MQNDLVQIAIQAKNTNDWGYLSNFNTFGAIIQNVPSQMQQPTRGPLTSINSLQINWVALQGDLTGSALIDSYNLQWDNGTNSVTWTDLSGDGIISSFSTLTTLQITNGVVAGTTYNIRVRARNALGWSVWSSVL